MIRKVIKKKKRNIQVILVLQFIVSIIFIGIVKLLNILPSIYFFALSGFVLFVFLISCFIQIKKNRKSTSRKISIIISSILIIMMIIGSVFVFKGYDTLSRITGHDYMTEKISVIVLNTNSAKKINDVKDEMFAVRDIIDLDNTNYAIEKINEKLNTSINTKKYIDFNTQINDFYKGTTKVLILNETYRELIKERFSDFDEKTKVIYTVERKIPLENGGVTGNASVKKIFNIYISGIDTYGSIDSQGRSDVNIIATVNPETKEILLTSIPRDYYVPLYGDEDKYDKLTHAGMYGVDCSISTIEVLLKTNIDYYVKVNFSSLINIVDAIGGVDVDSPYAFDVLSYHYIKGVQHMDGGKALMFARDRYNMPGGDRDRGKNQETVITAIINKLTSPAVIINYSNILTAIAGSFQTNMTANEISSLIQTQLTDMATWKITSINLDGSDAHEATYTFGSEVLYVMKPYEDSLNEAINKISEMFKSVGSTDEILQNN